MIYMVDRNKRSFITGNNQKVFLLESDNMLYFRTIPLCTHTYILSGTDRIVGKVYQKKYGLQSVKPLFIFLFEYRNTVYLICFFFLISSTTTHIKWHSKLNLCLSKLYGDTIKKMEAIIFVINVISIGCLLGVKEQLFNKYLTAKTNVNSIVYVDSFNFS